MHCSDIGGWRELREEGRVLPAAIICGEYGSIALMLEQEWRDRDGAPAMRLEFKAM